MGSSETADLPTVFRNRKIRGSCSEPLALDKKTCQGPMKYKSFIQCWIHCILCSLALLPGRNGSSLLQEVLAASQRIEASQLSQINASQLNWFLLALQIGHLCSPAQMPLFHSGMMSMKCTCEILWMDVNGLNSDVSSVKPVKVCFGSSFIPDLRRCSLSPQAGAALALQCLPQIAKLSNRKLASNSLNASSASLIHVWVL